MSGVTYVAGYIVKFSDLKFLNINQRDFHCLLRTSAYNLPLAGTKVTSTLPLTVFSVEPFAHGGSPYSLPEPNTD